MPLILSIDTSTDNFGLCLYNPEEGESWTIQKPNLRRQSDVLHLQINQLLVDSGKNIKDLGLVVASRGPGSFTGVRVGLAAAQGLSLGLNIPCFGVDTFSAIAFEHFNQNSMENSLTIAIDAHGGDIYFAKFNSESESSVPPCVIKGEELSGNMSDGITAYGNAFSKYLPEISIDNVIASPHPLNLAKLGLRYYESGMDADLSPMYLKQLSYTKISDRK